MSSEAERLAIRVTRLERLVIAMAMAIHYDDIDKGLDYFLVHANNDSQADRKYVEELISDMKKDMERSAQTGQV